MDRKWMSADRLSKEYEDGVREFIRFAVQHAMNPSKIICPCVKCCFANRITKDELEEHLVCYGIVKSYTSWVRHGETRDKDNNAGNSVRRESNDECEYTWDNDRIEEIQKVVEEELHDCPEIFDRLLSDAEKPLYGGCSKYTRLSAVLKLYNLKAGNRWSDKSFTELLALLKDMLPEDNVLPGRTYEAKRMLRSIGMSYEKIHACPNDCILFRNEYASLSICPKCNAS